MKDKLGNRKIILIVLISVIIIIFIFVYIKNTRKNFNKAINTIEGGNKINNIGNSKKSSLKVDEEKIPEKYKYKKVLEENYVVKIVEGNSTEVIDISKLSNFIKNFKTKKNDEIFIIEYLQKGDIRVINYVINMKIQGDKVKFTKYDVDEKGILKVNVQKSFVEIVETGDNYGVKVVGRENKFQKLKETYTILNYSKSQATEWK